MKEKSKITGLVMTYNCAGELHNTLNHLPKGLLDEIIIVDDGSADDISANFSAYDFAALTKTGKGLFFTHKHLGYGGNLRYGLKKAIELGADYIIEIHGDGQFDPSAASLAVLKMQQEDLDFLIGSRFTKGAKPLRDGMPLLRYLANIGLSAIEKLFLRLPFTEYHAGFRAYSRRFLEKIDLEKGANDYLYSFQIICQAAYFKARCGEIPVRANYLKKHTSVGYWRAAKNSFQEMWVLAQYIAAKLGVKIRLFLGNKKSVDLKV